MICFSRAKPNDSSFLQGALSLSLSLTSFVTIKCTNESKNTTKPKRKGLNSKAEPLRHFSLRRWHKVCHTLIWISMSFHFFEIDSVWLLRKKKVKKSNKKAVVKVKRNVEIYLMLMCLKFLLYIRCVWFGWWFKVIFFSSRNIYFRTW